MPRRGRHRTSLPARLIAAVAALLLTLGVVVVAGSAAADDSGDAGGGGGGGGILSSLTGSESSDGSSDGGDESENDGSGDESGNNGSGESPSESGSNEDSANGDDSRNDDNQNQQDADEDQQDGSNQQDDQGRRDDQGGEDRQSEQQRRQDALVAAGQRADPADPFPGRDQIAPAGANDYVDINDVEANGNIGEGGAFNRGSYSVDCGVSDHNNSDNYMAAPGKRNGAQHVHDYVGNTTTDANSDESSLQEGATSCVNGDQSVFFWPVVRDLNGTGPDVGEDGGSLDGNVGSILKPRSAELSFRGHGDREVQPMPAHLMIIMGNAKAGAQDQANVNAKYTCEKTPDRVTDKYPICGDTGGRLVRTLDYPSCWDGENLETQDLRSHMTFPDERGNCKSDEVPVPALRITLTYDQPEGRAFSIDSFPNEQHDPRTDHSDFENLATEAQSRRGAECINTGEQCANIPREG